VKGEGKEWGGEGCASDVTRARASPHSPPLSPLPLHMCTCMPMGANGRPFKEAGLKGCVGGRGARASDVTRARGQAHTPPSPEGVGGRGVRERRHPRACKPTLPSSLPSSPPYTCAHACQWEPMAGNSRRLDLRGVGRGRRARASDVTRARMLATSPARACKPELPRTPPPSPLSPSHPPTHLQCTYSANRSQWQTIGGIWVRGVGGEGRLSDFPVAAPQEFA